VTTREKLVTTIEVDDKGSTKLRAASREMEQFGKTGSRSFAGVKTSYLGMAAVIAGSAFAAKKIFDFARAGAQLRVLEQSFRRLGGSAASLAALQAAVHGTVDDATLIRFSNMASTLGINNEQFVELARVSKAASKLLGIDMKYAIESVTTGTARQSKLWLDNLGIIIDTEAAYKRAAVAMGKTVEQMTDVEKKQAFINAVIKDGAVLIGKAGAEGTLVDGYDRLSAGFGNWINNVKKTTAELPRDLYDFIFNPGKWLNEARAAQGAGMEEALIAGDMSTNTMIAKQARMKAAVPTKQGKSALFTDDQVRMLQLRAIVDAEAEKQKVMTDSTAALLLIQSDRMAKEQDMRQMRIDGIAWEADEEQRIQLETVNAVIAMDMAQRKSKEDLARANIDAARMGLQALATIFPKAKGFAIGEALVNTYLGITKALGSAPPPVNFAMAALVAAQGFAAVRAIQSQGITGGGGTSTYAYGGATPTVPVSGGGQDISISIMGTDNLVDKAKLGEMFADGFADLLQSSGGSVGNINIQFEE